MEQEIVLDFAQMVTSLPEGALMYRAMQIEHLYVVADVARQQGLPGRAVPFSAVSEVVVESQAVVIMVGNETFRHRTDGPTFAKRLAGYELNVPITLSAI